MRTKKISNAHHEKNFCNKESSWPSHNNRNSFNFSKEKISAKIYQNSNASTSTAELPLSIIKNFAPRQEVEKNLNNQAKLSKEEKFHYPLEKEACEIADFFAAAKIIRNNNISRIKDIIKSYENKK